MADKCAICGAEINLFQTQKLADGKAICRKNCRSKGFKCFDYVHATLPMVEAHLAQVERGTKLWEHYFAPRLKEKDKSKKLKRFAGYLYVAEDLGLTAFVQVDYKFFIFGKSYRACVFRTADLVNYDYEQQEIKTSNGTEKKEFIKFAFIGVNGLADFSLSLGNVKEYETISKYFDTQFGIQKTLDNAAANWKRQSAAIKSVAAGIGAMMKNSETTQEKIAEAAEALDTAVYGDRTELIRRGDEALAAFNG